MFFMPISLKKILELVPSMGLELFEFKAYFKHATRTIKLLADTQDYLRQVEKIKRDPKFSDFHVTAFNQGTEIHLDKKFGEEILRLYFLQLFRPGTCFLDFSPKHFGTENGKLAWSPSKLRHEFDPAFLGGLQDVYRGFFLSDDALFQKGLRSIKLVPDHATPAVEQKIESLFVAHFGQAKQGPVKFELAHFQQSFEQLFSFLIEKKIQLSPEFAFLGIYLSTLYQTLDQLGLELDVQGAFQGATAGVKTEST